MNNRDDFSDKTKRAVAARAGWQCSFQGCSKLTVGPSEEAPSAITNIGEAAHICAASPGGRRYEPAMTPAERASIDNAMWVCTDHAKLIDRDAVTYPADRLRAMKRAHEERCARAVRLGSSSGLSTGLLAIGPDIVCTADLISVSAGTWTLRLEHFLIGDMHAIMDYIDGFQRQPPEVRYVLSNELGDGRVLLAPPGLTNGPEGAILLCEVAPSADRIDAQRLGSDMALHPETNDFYLDEKGGIARVSGLAYLPQKIRTVLSTQRGESVFWPTLGMRFSEYYEAFRGSPWLNLLLKLDVVRQASVPRRDSLTGTRQTPLRCVKRVRGFELLAAEPQANKLPVRIEFEIQGVGAWQNEFSIYMPTAAEMAERGKMIADAPWLSVERAIDYCAQKGNGDFAANIFKP
ncbi:hypothetical protein [Methylobacterium sp. J-077]|uniref:hypothetical protein n=1 Tax=Methylobacterium sp. J-077 TaxID=2836656 RepID=UPI001FBA3361|nr:hypothetical protein [Methylobacterium sp. J-077]MCJ2125711.1 hypothetical protein [Methylobacterium sp. J-077]